MYVYSPLLFHTLQLFGLLPFSVRHLPLGRQVATVSRPLVYYSYLLAALFSLSFGFWIHENLFSELLEDPRFWINRFSTISIVTFVFGHVCEFAPVVVCLLDVALRCEQRIQILEKLQEIDFQLQRADSPVDTRHVASLAFGYAMVLLCCETYTDKFAWLSNSTVFLIHKVISLSAMLEFAELVFNVRDRFRLVNERTLEVVRRTKSHQEVWTTALPAVETFTMPQELYMTISTINLAHWELCCLISDINDVYALQLTVITGQIFYSLLLYNYFIYLDFRYNLSVFGVALRVSWVSMYLAQLFILTWPCSRAVNEAMRTASVAAEQLGRVKGTPIKDELKSFIRQLFQREASFSVWGLFTLQTSSVLSVIGAVITYLAIIIQLKNAAVQSPTTVEID